MTRKDIEITRQRLHEIVFEADTRAEKNFDIALVAGILTNVAIVMLDSVPSMRKRYRAGPIMITGYDIIAVPTGIVTSEWS